MNKHVYIQNSKFEWLQSTFLHEPVFVSEKIHALDFKTEKRAEFIAGLCGIRDFYITTTMIRHVE